jgi:hypothetical protein
MRNQNTNKNFDIIILGFLIITLLMSSFLIVPGENVKSIGPIVISSTSRENAWPYVNITNPANEATVSGVINITGFAWDSDGYITNVYIRINGSNYSANDSSGNDTWYQWYVNFNTTILPDGEYRIVAISQDNGSKLGDFGVWILIKNTPEPKENQKPLIWIEQPSNNSEVSGEIIIKGHAKDDVSVRLVDLVIAEKEYIATDTSGNDTWWSWKLVFNTTILDNGKYWVTAWAWDEKNLGGNDKIVILVNNTKPENKAPYVEVTQPKNEATVSGVIKIKGRAGDPDGNISIVKIRIYEVWYNATDISGNGSWYYWSLNFDTTKLKDGEYKVTAGAWDNLEKAADDSIWIIIKNTKENHWPYVNITQPNNEAKVKGEIVISGFAWDIDGNITKVRVKIADVWYNATDDSGNGSWYKWSLKFNTSILKDGEYRVVVLSYDDGGKAGDEGIWILVKNTPEEKENLAPYIEITQPKNEANVSGLILIKGKAKDPDGNVSIVKIRIYETLYNATDKSGNGTWFVWELKFNTTVLKDGEYRITAIAYDNKEKAEDIHIWIIVKNKKEEKENKAPFINITQPKMDENVSGVVVIKGYANDPDGNISYVRIRIGETWYNATDTSGNGSWYTWEYLWNTSGFENGSYRISVLAFDGKLNEDAHVELNLNNTVTPKNEQNKKDEKPKPRRIPGFEGPAIIIAMVAAVVVSFFRSGRFIRTK